MHKLLLQDLDIKGKRALVRVDFNVPLSPDGSVTDTTRIKESLPSIQYILDKGGSVILMSHLGRPNGKRDPHLSLAPCAKVLSQLLHKPVTFVEHSVGSEVEKSVRSLKSGEVLLLENLRFYSAEEDPDSDPSFARQLSLLGDSYVNDAFGTAHRAHSSTATIAKYFPGKAAAGLLMQKEIAFLGNLVNHPKRPFYAIIGGAKISSKMGVLDSLLSKVDGIFIGGGMAYTFFKAQNIEIGESIHEDSQLPVAKSFMEKCALKKIELYLPKDILIADAFSNSAHNKTISIKEGIPKGWQGMDIGPKTTQEWISALQKAATLFWNGPLGVFEMPSFAQGTQAIAKALSKLQSERQTITVVGGGDSVAAINTLNLSKKFSHVSTGGGASLEYIEFGHLPGIDALSDSQ